MRIGSRKRLWRVVTPTEATIRRLRNTSAVVANAHSTTLAPLVTD